jgi:hypothetical protein
MKEYEPTKEQEQAIREYLHKSIVPLIEQVLVKKLGQAMSYAAQELVNPKREWVGLTDEEIEVLCDLSDDPKHGPWYLAYARFVEAKLKEKNT